MFSILRTSARVPKCRTPNVYHTARLHVTVVPTLNAAKLEALPTTRLGPPLARTFTWTRTLHNSSPVDPNTQRESLKESSITPTKRSEQSAQLRENIYTIPNALTISRILACPVIGYAILHDQYYLSTSLLMYAGFTDLLDGFIARRYNMQSVVGTILDPAADKTLMTTLTVTLAMQGLLPVPLAGIILGRDVLLSLSAFYIRYKSLPAPKTFSRYWDFSLPSAEVRPTTISKYNTALQLLLMLATAVSPIVPHDVSTPLTGLQWVVAGTTIWSGLSYVFSKNAVRIVARKGPQP